MKINYNGISTQDKKANTKNICVREAATSYDLSPSKQIKPEERLKQEKPTVTTLIARWKKVDAKLVCYWHKE